MSLVTYEAFCLTFYSAPSVVFLTGFTRVLVGFATPATVVVTTIIPTFVKVTKNTVVKDKKLIQCTARLIVVLLLAAFSSSSPSLLLYFGSCHGFHQGFIEMLSAYIVQMNYVLYPILIMMLHKQTRESILDKLCLVKRQRAIGRVSLEASQSNENLV